MFYSAVPAGFGVVASADVQGVMSATIYDLQILAHDGFACLVRIW